MKTTMRILLATTLGLVLMAPQGVEAGRKDEVSQDIERARLRRATAPTDSRAIRLQGEVGHARRGFVVDGQTVLFTERTSFFPSNGDVTRERNVKALRGKVATVYGRKTERGIEASLVIVAGDPTVNQLDVDIDGLVDGRVEDPSVYRIPSESDDSVGEMADDAPR